MANSVDMEELNRLKESIAEKERMANEASSQPAPVATQPSAPATTVVFAPEVKEPLQDRALSQTQRSSEAVGEMVTDILKQGVVHVVTNDEEVRGEILGAAKESVKNKVQAISDQTAKEAQASAYDVNSDACENYGIMKDVPKWKINMMRVGSAFWFIIYFIFASLTVAPITIFVKGLVGVIKQVWLAAVVAILFYLIIAVGVPFLITLI